MGNTNTLLQFTMNSRALRKSKVVPIAEDVVGEKVGDTEQDKGPDAPKDDPLVIDAPEDQRPQHEFVERAETEGDTSKQEHHF
ncbi:MAG: hypothetical protein H6574_22775 [Lewinellaceae bacterium]|nr:hypothetical protein [Lewinellaceae bacterium]